MPFAAGDNPHIAITGILSRRRAEISGLISQAGGRFDSAVTSTTSWLVVGRSPGGVKLNAANRYRVPQITETEFMEYCRTGVQPQRRYELPSSVGSVRVTNQYNGETAPTTSTGWWSSNGEAIPATTSSTFTDVYGNPVTPSVRPKNGPKPAPTPDYERFSISDFFFVDDADANSD
jgi:hypothetical protein